MVSIENEPSSGIENEPSSGILEDESPGLLASSIGSCSLGCHRIDETCAMSHGVLFTQACSTCVPMTAIESVLTVSMLVLCVEYAAGICVATRLGVLSIGQKAPAQPGGFSLGDVWSWCNVETFLERW